MSMFNVAFNSRPIPKLWLTGRFRYRNFNQKTPEYLWGGGHLRHVDHAGGLR